MAASFPSSFLAPPFARFSRSAHPPTPLHRHLPLIETSPQLQLEATPSPVELVPSLGDAPSVVFVAVILAIAAQSWINSLLGGDQGLGAFLSDGGGFNKSGFKPRTRKRPNMDYRTTVPGDNTEPLGGPDPLPWLKLPELDFVDVAGQPKKPKQMRQSMKDMPPSSIEKDDSKVIARLEFLREQMKIEIKGDNLEGAKEVENELKRVMKKEGYDYSA